MGYTVRLGEAVGTDARLAGGKGASLSALIEAGFRVPAGFVVTTDAYRDFIDAAGLGAATPEQLREQIPSTEIPERITEAIISGYVDLEAPLVAVRSSGTAEDLADASFAGQHDTYLEVSGSRRVLAAVRNCWASLWTERAVAYRSRNGWDESNLALAVVVQRMVDAEFAGVLFTADPVSGRRDRVVLEAVRGLGESLVSGEATGEHYVVDKRTRRVLLGGCELPEIVLRELVNTGVEVESHFSRPQDIEWTYAGGRVSLVQARPLTALPDPTGRSDESAPKTRRPPRGNYSVAADHMPYPPFPLDTSLFILPAIRSIVGGLRSAGFDLPAATDVLVEIDDGVVQIVPPTVRPRWSALLGVPVALPRAVSLLRTRTSDWRAKAAVSLLRQADRLDSEDLATLTDAELLTQVRSLLSTMGSLLPARFGALPAGIIAEQVATRLLRLVVGRGRADQLHADLMSAVPCVTTASNDELDRIAETVRAAPELRTAYLKSEPAAVAARLENSAAGRQLLTRVDAYLRTYGFRELSNFTVGLPALRERPDVVHGLIKGRVLESIPQRKHPDRYQSARLELAAESTLRARLLRSLILRLSDAARDCIGFREDSHYQLTMALAVARRLLLELGGRLVQYGAFTNPDDIAYLTEDEIEHFVPDQARKLVAGRKAARAAALDHYTIVPADLLGPGGSRDRLRGTPASRGSVVGRVRIIHDESEFGTLKSGEVLVCRYTNPTWTPLFSLAAAVVVDTGGAASHAAIVAREHGIPAVMGTGNGTRILTDGQRVLVDADHGTVTSLTPAADRPVGAKATRMVALEAATFARPAEHDANPA